MLEAQMTIYVAGHRGMVGSAIVRRLKHEGYHNLVTATHQELDLTDQLQVRAFFKNNKIDYVVVAAAKVGGIFANNEYPAEFIYQNLMIECNLIHEAYLAGVKDLLFLGSSCIYPKFAEQPMKETALLAGELEPTNEPYAIAKIAGIKLCESYNRQYATDYRSVMPTNLYGPGDNYHGQNSHVVPALIKKFHEAKMRGQMSVEVWGTGRARREFLHVDDLADACFFLMRLPQERLRQVTSEMSSHINIGSGRDITIEALVSAIQKITQFTGEVVFNSEYSDGAPRKLMDSRLLDKLGWQASISLEEGLADAYRDFLCSS